MRTSTRWWIAGFVVALVVAFIAWVGTREEVPTIPARDTTVTTGTVVVMSAAPVTARAGVPALLTWSVRAPVGSTTTHTAIHWGMTPNPSPLGSAVAPPAAGYPNALSDYARGSFGLPREFTGAVTFDRPGTYVYRAHAVIDQRNVWSPEYSIVVE